MSGSVKEFKSETKKGLRVSVWQNERGNSYTIEKAYKKKDDTEWTRQKVTLFPEELSEMAFLMTQAVDYEVSHGERAVRQNNDYEREPAVSGAPPTKFDDDDIDF